MFRRLRVLAAFCMVPVVILAAPTSAAAVNPNPWHELTIGSNYNGTCDFNVQQETQGSALIIGPGGVCSAIGDVSPGYAQVFEAGSHLDFYATGVNGAGEVCGGVTLTTLGQHASNGTGLVAGTIPSGSISLGGRDSAGCTVQEICLVATSTGFMSHESRYCQDVDIPWTPGTETGSCIWGTPTVTLSVVKVSQQQYSSTWKIEANLLINGEQPPGRMWAISGYQDGFTSIIGSLSFNRLAGEDTKLFADTRLTQNVGENYENSSPPPELWVKGVEVSAAFDGWNAHTTDVDPKQQRLAVAPFPPGSGSLYGGWTDPAHCRFWFGPQVLTVAGQEGDTPAGALNSSPVTEEPPPPITQPEPVADPVDEPSFWGAILGILRAIWAAISAGMQAVVDAVQSLGAAIAGIADSILDGLSGLFVPEDGFLESRFTTVESKWADTSPAKYMDAASGFTVGAASGCGGLPLSVALPGGVQLDEHIGAACSGGMASAAGVVRAVLTAVVVVSGMFACMRAIGSGLGWNPGIGRGAV